jgi:response regulator of citrate/malate metabolism
MEAEPVAGALYPVYDQQREWKIVDQQNVDSLYQLQAKNYRVDSGSKGIEEKTLALVQGLFSGREAHCFSVDEVVSAAGLSKTTARAIWNTALRPAFWKWRCCMEKSAIRGGCTDAHA